MRKPVVLTDVSVDPVRQGETAGPCEVCEGESRWIAGRPLQTRFFCAHCFLYETDGGRRDADQIAELVRTVEEKMGRPISKDGKATREHSDRILGSIVMMTRMVRSSKKMKKIKAKAQEDDEGNRS